MNCLINQPFDFSAFVSILNYPFVWRALIAGCLVACCAALLGVILTLKGYSLIGHGLSDVGFASLSLALALGLPPLYISLPVVIVASFAIMSISQKKGIKGDLAISVAATSSLALGVIITSLTKGFNMDVYEFMFGSILTISKSDLVLSIVLAIFVVCLFVLFYNKIFLITCDEPFAKASGVNVSAFQFLIAFLTAITIVIGMRMMGSLLISSLIIFPSISAKKLSKRFKQLVIYSGIISVLCFVVGVFAAFALNLPTGASIVFVNVIFMIIVNILSKGRV